MEESTPNKVKMHTGILAWLPEIIIVSIIGIAATVVLLWAKKKGWIGTSEADKLQAAQDTKDKANSIDLSKQQALKVSSVSDFIKYGLGASELKNQYPWSPEQETEFVQQVYADKTLVGKGNGSGSVGIIGMLRSKFEVAQLSLAFETAYKQDLNTFWESNLTDAARASIDLSIKDKPDFARLLPASQTLLNNRKQTLTL